MKKIYIYFKETESFLPETKAYLEYLESRGFIVSFGSDIKEAREFDLVIIYFGFIPFWKFKGFKRSQLIGEYHSLSTGSYPILKNLLKRLFNVKCGRYIFLNESVRKGYFFTRATKKIYRPMGFDSQLANHYKKSHKKYHFVYCGSLNRTGVIEYLKKIDSLGYSIIVIGNSEQDKRKLQSTRIVFKGRLDRDDCYFYMSQAVAGINYTPVSYPFYLQDSTKVKEYLGLGLMVLTNSYHWVDKFLLEVDSEFFYFDDLFEKGRISSINVDTDLSELKNINSGSEISDHSWSEILRKCNFINFLNQS
ncbi:hypothetical protein AB4562_24345 [Vibrio sp. 10N.222.54.A1]|uniref:hypothetical protein n=1 Tax=unclassified Vibrio TaxID=2614977 RepID=UPI000C85E742|nr:MULTISPECIES: hypothetical protein [unclassified Vibrio]PMK81574.1 hypothetical protein BCT92_15000 [Vibrio sp. 10N.261.52.E5]TKF80415.1 hypothetical protein FCV65_19865 [Vibrio sp. F13]